MWRRMGSGSPLESFEEPRGRIEPDTADTALIDDQKSRFSAFMRAEFEWVWRVLRRVGLSPADADDATQQVFLVASRRGAEVQTRPFLYATAIRVAANARRAMRRRREVPTEGLASVSGHDPPAEDLVEQRRARALLDELLAQLPPELCRVLVLAEIEQLTAQQIAELESLPAGTVASRLRRARATFYALLERTQLGHPFDAGPR